jgi:hypothetical protein
MHEIKQIPPDKMTPEQRCQEVAALLANGLARFRIKPPIAERGKLPANGLGLGFSGNQSVHTDDVNNRQTECL